MTALCSLVFDKLTDGMDTRDWVTFAESLARLRFSPGTDAIQQLCKYAKYGIIEGSKDG